LSAKLNFLISVDLVNRVKILNLVTQYFNAIIYFLKLQMLPKQIEEDPTRQIIQCDFTSLIHYANKRLVVKYYLKKKQCIK